MKKRTSTNMIHEVLADRIVHGILKPGDPLDETSLASEFGVSRTPVREALRQLETNGLALSRPHRGTIVTTLTDRQLDETFVVMAELEALCARLCASHLQGSALSELMALHHEGEDAAKTNDVEAYRAHNERFHTAIYAGSGNSFLEATTLAVRRRLAPFRNLQFEAFQRPEASHREHAKIVDAIIEGDGERAASAMRDHLRIVRKAVDAVNLGG
ncbi:transcriptional regulator, GntR family [Fulvimarina manganoxydans]|uniref:Transcriptional regulator, GntR family n=1 Tax=Fulvimarina manganoxydans TaxID=937218 RepID=A0A1W2BD52_9HYPH|nr:GntR family transcriptional regulator [Fulvimarina manganoxydans]SMC70751.1 transcriptional regulator, GntR family [Fulvimarina manganoxydans]